MDDKKARDEIEWAMHHGFARGFQWGATFAVVGTFLVSWFLYWSWPLYWDSNRKLVENNLGTQKGKITITIGWNPDSPGGSLSFLTGTNTDPWDESLAASFQKKEDAIKARNKMVSAWCRDER